MTHVSLLSPGGLAVLSDGGQVISDTGYHRRIVASADGQVRQVIGGPQPGFANGLGATATFQTPRGSCLTAEGDRDVADH